MQVPCVYHLLLIADYVVTFLEYFRYFFFFSAGPSVKEIPNLVAILELEVINLTSAPRVTQIDRIAPRTSALARLTFLKE